MSAPEGSHSALNPLLRWLLIGIGCVSLALGVIGLFFPILPTTPFLLLSAATFMRSSRTLYRWLMTHPRFGQTIYQYREVKVFAKGTLISTLVLLWLGIAVSIYFVPLWQVDVFLLLIAVAVTFHLSRFKILTPLELAASRASHRQFVIDEFGEESAS